MEFMRGNKPFSRLLLINATLAGSLFLIMAVFRYGNLVKTSAALVILYSLPFLLFVVSIVVLPIIIWHSVRTDNFSNMEGWWWLSVPYSLAFPCSVFAFRMQQFGHALELFLFVYMISLFCSFIWLMVVIYKLIISPEPIPVMGRHRTIMLTAVIISVFLLIALRASA